MKFLVNCKKKISGGDAKYMIKCIYIKFKEYVI